jgi:glutathione S-transferase
VPYELETYKRGSDKLADPKLKEVHPLGKSPIVTIERPGSDKPLVLIESAAIVEYLCDYYGRWLVPERYLAGKDGQIGGETESWIRYRTYMHYAEGSIMPLMLLSLIVASKFIASWLRAASRPGETAELFSDIQKAPVPFFLKPVTNGIANRIQSSFLAPNFKTHYKFLEGQLASSEGEYLCGRDLSAADILMSFPLEAGQSRSGMTKEQYPKIWSYLDRLHERDAYKRAVKKIEEVEGSFKTNL